MPRRSSTAVRWSAWERSGRQAVLASPLAPITFPTTRLRFRIEIALGADPAGDPADWSWLDITQWVRYKRGIQITYGRRDEAARVDAATARLTLGNQGGRFSRRNPLSPYYGLLTQNTPIRIGVDPGDGVHYRFHGFVNEWPTRWTDRSGKDSTVPIVCGGVLRRLAGSGTLRSAMFRSMSGVAEGDFRPIAYVPMEDGSGATRFASGLAGGLPASFAGSVSLATYSAIVGSGSLPTLSDGGQITWRLPSYTDTGVWQWQGATNFSQLPGTDTKYLEIDLTPATGSTIRRIRVISNTVGGSLDVQLLNSVGTVVSSNGVTFSSIDLDHPRMMALTHFTSSGTTQVQLGFYNDSGTFEEATSVIHAGVPGMPRQVRAYATSGNSGWSTGHWALYTDPAILTSANIAPNARAMSAFAGELAHERAIRLCREEGVSLVCTSAISPAMGPQADASLLDNLRACETTDGGVLFESEFGLGFQSLDDRLNAPVQFELDFDQSHIADTPEPADDDQRIANRITVARSDGSYEIVEDADSIATNGLYETPRATVNVDTDDELLDVGGRRLAAGTVDEDRWPALPIRLSRTPDLIPSWTALPYGARMTVANPPPEVAPDTIDAVVEGWAEAFNPKMWAAVLNTSPASVYKIGRIAGESGDTGEDVGHLESDSCTLAADVTSSDTTWSVNTTPLASTAADDMGFLIRFAGEVVEVTAISGAANPQTWTVERAINGVNKAQTADTPGRLVRPFMPTQ